MAVKCKWMRMNREGGVGGGREHEKSGKEYCLFINFCIRVDE